MYESEFIETIKTICAKDKRFEPDAYIFVREALDFAVKKLKRPAEGPGRHVSGQELLEGIRVFALHEFGPMTLTVLKTWGLNRTEDFGEIVFNLVESGKLGKTDKDKREDFAGAYGFEDAFAKPFLPTGQQSPKRKTVRASARRNPATKHKTTTNG
jgi:uncharacterized repeat protein (TIGR04138 family)